MTETTSTTKIDKLLIQLLSGATDRDADTPKRREKGAARFDKAYLGIVAYVSKLEKDLAAYKANTAVMQGLAKQQNAMIKAQLSDLKALDKENARLERALLAEENKR